ncbi:type II methionyl aminopeptidase [Candidatus Woesearchaeota archaeon]|nr:type II methionyl aminopeptidase [Candidatus Woesearchaeota archaeon]
MDKETIEKYKKAGKIAAQVLDYGRGLIKKDSSLLEVTEKIEKKIFELNAKPAFPVQFSMDHLAAHFCPEDDDKQIFSNQVVCLDVGVHIDGYIGDNALTVDLSGKYSDLVKSSREALDEAIKVVKVGAALGEIGKVIHNAIVKYGYSPVRNLSGHGLDQFVQHTKPSIPNFDTHDTSKIGQGMVFAIEPFASTGAGIVQDSGTASVYVLINKKPVRSPITREVLKEIESYEGLPFAKRWLTKKFGAKANFGLIELLQKNIIKGYNPLADTSKGIVSQAEHSLLIDNDGEVIITTKLD